MPSTSTRCPKCYCKEIILASSHASLMFCHIPGVVVKYKCSACGLSFRRKKNRVAYLSINIVVIFFALSLPFWVHLFLTMYDRKETMAAEAKSYLVRKLSEMPAEESRTLIRTTAEKQLMGTVAAPQAERILKCIDNKDFNSLRTEYDRLSSADKERVKGKAKEMFGSLEGMDYKSVKEFVVKQIQ